MTDNPHRAPLVTRNVKAELARAGLTATQARDHLEMARSTWDSRMADPKLWRLGELEALSALVGSSVAELVAIR